MIRASGIYKSYGDIQVLNNLSLDVQQGEIVAVVGKSGVGKSTLLHVLSTLDDCEAGEIIVADTPIHMLKGSALAAFRRQQIGFVFQFHHLLPEFTALENVMLPGRFARRDLSKLEAESKESLDYLGLSDRLHHRPSKLSGGEQQRVAIARALINRPRVIFADEPTGNLDTGTGTAMHALIRQIRQDFNTTFFIVTHNPGLADTADRKLTMHQGQLKEDKPDSH